MELDIFFKQNIKEVVAFELKKYSLNAYIFNISVYKLSYYLESYLVILFKVDKTSEI